MLPNRRAPPKVHLSAALHADRMLCLSLRVRACVEVLEVIFVEVGVDVVTLALRKSTTPSPLTTLLLTGKLTRTALPDLIHVLVSAEAVARESFGSRLDDADLAYSECLSTVD